MSFGPEYIYGFQAALNRSIRINPAFPWRVSKVEGGESWVALRTAGLPAGTVMKPEWLLFSWGTGSSGCCFADTPSIEALKGGAVARAPLAEALKSRFVKGQIVAARQLNFDRVLELEVVRFVAAGFVVTYYLILEATEPTANLILLDEERTIEELARHAPPDLNRYRTLLPGHLYVPPPAFEGPLPSEAGPLTFEGLSRIKGIGRPLIRAIEARWEEREPARWLEMLRSLYLESPESGAEEEGEKEEGKKGKEGEKGEEKRELLPQRISKSYFTRFPICLGDAKPTAGNVLDAAREGVLLPLLENSRSRLLRNLDTRVERAVKSKERHADGLLKQLKNSADAELFRRKGELLLANLAAVPPGAEKVTLRGWGAGAESKIELEKLEEPEELEITLDPRLSPTRNAERYFKKYKKARVDSQKIQEEIASLRSAVQELREQRDLLASIEDSAQLEEAARDVMEWLAPQTGKSVDGKGKAAKMKREKREKKEKDLPPHLRFEFNGYTVLVGLSARGNRFVTLKQAAGDDLWLHAHEVPGAHVIIRGARGREGLDGETLLFAASLAAAYSRDKTSGSVQVDYTERRYVRSVPGTVALVTYTRPGTVRVSPSPEK